MIFIIWTDKRIRIHIVCRKLLRAAFLSCLNIRIQLLLLNISFLFWLLLVALTLLRRNWTFSLRHIHRTRTVKNKHTFLGKKRHIIFQRYSYTMCTIRNTFTNPMVCHEFSTDNCMVLAGSIRGIMTWSLAARIIFTHTRILLFEIWLRITHIRVSLFVISNLAS